MFIKTLEFVNPSKVYEKLQGQNSALLESQKNGNHSYVALNPYMIFKSKGERIEIIKGKKRIIKERNPIKELKKIIQARKVKRRKDMPLFYSGGIGYFSYDIVHFFEKLPRTAKDDLKLPDIYLIFPKDIIFFDHKKRIMKIICKNKSDLQSIIKKLQKKDKISINHKPKKIRFKSNFTFNEYKKTVNKCKEYVRAGDSFQIKISQRFEYEIKETPFEIYKRLKKINPSPYAAFLNFEDCKLVSCSPEHLVKIENDEVETRPIGGTYPRSKNPDEDRKFAKKFMKDKKERAEHMMLIDLERNDLGKVCDYGTIRVSEMMTIEKYSHLMHIVTNIKGRLHKSKDVFDVLRAMFPGGTITGCPKIRTMEIIDEIEPVTRGPYTGSIGFINFSNEMDLNIIIRTLIIQGNKGYIQVGGGIVADSNPKKEHQETINKAKALLEAIK
jgi:para-aminobenzoate synthetase component I